MTDLGVVAIHPDRLEAFADTVLRAADDVLAARLRAFDAVASARRRAPEEVHDLSRVSARLRELGHDTRHRLDIVRRLPWDAWPAPTGIRLGRHVRAPYPAVDVVERLRDAGEVTPVLDRLVDVARDPYEAAAALGALGVDGFRRLYELARREALATPDEYDQRLEARVEQITGILFAASRTIDHPGGLPRSFVDDLFPGVVLGDGDGDSDGAIVERAGVVGALNQVLTASGAGQYLAAAATQATTGGVGTVIVRAGRVIAVAGMVASVIDGLASDGEGLAEGLAIGALGVVGAFVEGPVGWVAGGMALLLSLVMAVGERRGSRPARTYPTDRANPGGSHYVYFVDGAGVPVAPG